METKNRSKLSTNSYHLDRDLGTQLECPVLKKYFHWSPEEAICDARPSCWSSKVDGTLDILTHLAQRNESWSKV